MSLKEVMYKYLSWLMNEAKEDELLKEPVEGDLDRRLFIGEKDEYGWVKWRPSEKDEIYDFSDFEETTQITVHPSIKEYFNSYWFCTLLVPFEEYEFDMYALIPENYIKRYLFMLLNYKKTHNGQLYYFPIGTEQNLDHLLVIDNTTGEVMLEDSDTGEMKVLANSLYDFFKNGG